MQTKEGAGAGPTLEQSILSQPPPPYPPPLPMQLDQYIGRPAKSRMPARTQTERLEAITMYILKRLRRSVIRTYGLLQLRVILLKPRFISLGTRFTRFYHRVKGVLAALPRSMARYFKQFKQAAKPGLLEIKDTAKELFGTSVEEFNKFAFACKQALKNSANYLRQASQSPYKVFAIMGTVVLVMSLIASPFVSFSLWGIVAFSALVQLVIATKLKLSSP